MNIIANTCIGAYITRDILKEKYQNPFQWNIIDYDSLFYLIENFNTLKQANIKVIIEKNNNFPSLFINEKIKIDFVHIKLKSSSKKTPKNNNDIFIEDRDIIEYTKNKFLDRLSRMNESPIFVIQNQPNHPITGNMKKLLYLYNNIKSNYPIIILTNKAELKTKENILVLHTNKNLDVPKEMAHLLGNVMKRHDYNFS